MIDRNAFVRPDEATPFVFEPVKYTWPEVFSKMNMRHYLGFGLEADQAVDRQIEELTRWSNEKINESLDLGSE